MTAPSPNLAASIRARLLARAKQRNESFEYVLTRYASERLLYRLSVSRFRDQFILKGATLFATWTGVPHRPTRDIDFLAYGEPIETAVEATFREIATQAVDDDGLVFHTEGIRAEPMREEEEYRGLRLFLPASLGAARMMVKIDLGYGDAVTPEPVYETLPTYLDQPAPRLRAYPRSTVIAEKLEAMVRLGLVNSRLKDYYDLWILSQRFDFDGAELASAISNTFTRRNTPLPLEEPAGLTIDYTGDESHRRQWRAFLQKSDLTATAPLELRSVARQLSKFLMPALEAIANQQPFDKRWIAAVESWQ